jgi:predicted ester cyclase
MAELFAPSYVFHSTPEVRGPEGVRKMFADLLHSFPDYEETVEHMVAEGEW